MSHEHGMIDFERATQRRKDLERFLVHEARRVRRAARRRAPEAVARVHYGAAAGRRGHSCRKVAPQRDRSESIVQKHKRRPIQLVRGEGDVFEAMAAGLDEARCAVAARPTDAVVDAAR